MKFIIEVADTDVPKVENLSRYIREKNGDVWIMSWGDDDPASIHLIARAPESIQRRTE